jgi:hypothetical protein
MQKLVERITKVEEKQQQDLVGVLTTRCNHIESKLAQLERLEEEITSSTKQLTSRLEKKVGKVEGNINSGLSSISNQVLAEVTALVRDRTDVILPGLHEVYEKVKAFDTYVKVQSGTVKHEEIDSMTLKVM